MLIRTEIQLPSRAYARSAAGFTIVEAMIALAILAILLAVATPSVRSMIDKQRVRGACEAIYQTYALTRSSSVSLNKNVTFNLRTGASWCVAAYDASATGCDCSNSAAAANCTVNGIKRTTSYDELGGSNGATVSVSPSATSVDVVFSARDAAPSGTPPTEISVISDFWACKLKPEGLGQIRYLKKGSSTGVTIVPKDEATSLNY